MMPWNYENSELSFFSNGYSSYGLTGNYHAICFRSLSNQEVLKCSTFTDYSDSPLVNLLLPADIYTVYFH